jgi:hypothetical protein
MTEAPAYILSARADLLQQQLKCKKAGSSGLVLAAMLYSHKLSLLRMRFQPSVCFNKL